MDRQVRVALLGAGYMGRLHADRLSKIPGVSLVSACSLPVKDAENLAASFPQWKINTYDDFDRMLEKESFDALYVCIPPFAHEGQVEKAAKKGIHIFVEKPIALTTERAASMVEAVKEAGVIAQVGYHMRFGAAVKELKKLMEDGTAGKPTLFDARYECNSLHTPWWRSKDKSGGQVFEQVIHLYDLSLFFLGEPELVSGFTANLCHTHIPDYTIEDTSVSAIRFKSGALANIAGTNNAVPMAWNNPFTVVCEKLTAFFTDANEAEFVFTAGEKPERKVVKGDRDMYLEEDLAFIASIRGEGPRAAPIEEGYTGLRLVDAVVRSSMKNGMPVVL